MANHATNPPKPPPRTRYDFDADGNLFVVQVDRFGRNHICKLAPDDARRLADFILAAAAKEAA